MVNQLTLGPDGQDPPGVSLKPFDGFDAVDGFGLAGVYDVWRPMRRALTAAGYVEEDSMVRFLCLLLGALG